MLAEKVLDPLNYTQTTKVRQDPLGHHPVVEPYEPSFRWRNARGAAKAQNDSMLIENRMEVQRAAIFWFIKAYKVFYQQQPLISTNIYIEREIHILLYITIYE